MCFVGKTTGERVRVPEIVRDDFTPEKAHSLFTSDRIFYALCTSRRIENRSDEYGSLPAEETYRVQCFNSSSRSINGFVKEINSMHRPYWESGCMGLARAEFPISKDLLSGSARFGFPGINEGSNLLVRLVGDNSHMRKPSVTSFFEPVITIRKEDEALDPNTRDKIFTTVTDREGEVKTREYVKGDLVKGIPIISTFQTERFGEVGVGYVIRPESEFEGISILDRQPFFLKRVWVQGGAEHLGNLVRVAEIFSNKNVIIANVID